MRPARVLVVDDSVLGRRAVAERLRADSGIDVVGVAATTSLALQRLAYATPDVVVLDATLDDVPAVEAVQRIRSQWPTLPILVAWDGPDHGAALAAVEGGANDLVAKPALGTEGGLGEISAKVHALVARRPSLAPARSVRPSAPRVVAPVTAIAIGSSTGGPNALACLFASLPRALRVPIFIVQHMLPTFSKAVAARLTSSTGYDVVEAQDGDIVVEGRSYIAPGDLHMTVVRDAARASEVRIALHRGPPESSCRPSVDVLFRSIASVYRAGALGAVLTGMGSDGTSGARAVVDAGGRIVVQEPSSAVVATMPASVMKAVEVDGVYPIEELAAALVARVGLS